MIFVITMQIFARKFWIITVDHIRNK